MPLRNILSDKKLWLLLLILVALRLPNINRPLSKHHEFNTAVILINAESWEQAGGGKQFSYTPLLTYQGKANHLLEKGWHIDAKGNHVYLSFGAGWYALPYFLFKALHVRFTPLSLRILSIIIGLLTTIMLYWLLMNISGAREHALAGTILFVLLPAPLWYCGISYVTTAIMLPMVIGILYQWHSFEISVDNINIKRLFIFFLLGILLCYFDWLAVFLYVTIALWAIFKARRNSRYLWISFIAAISVIAGVVIVLWQFANYLGWAQVLHYWQSRFSDRSTDTSAYSFSTMTWMIVRNLLIGFLPMFLLIAFAWVRKNTNKKTQKISWPIWALAAIIPYNGIFFNWSAMHEFAWLAFALFASLASSIYILPLFNTRELKQLLFTTTVLSLLQYYIINLPGNVSWKGERYDQQMQLGNWIRQHADSALPIFTNISNDKVVEFYSKRTFNTVASLHEAITLANSFGIEKGIWLEVKNQKVERAVRFFPPVSH
ncbi:hypothetical protein BH10BAC3_BH10BAC3_11450 [soil metagenome]